MAALGARRAAAAIIRRIASQLYRSTFPGVRGRGLFPRRSTAWARLCVSLRFEWDEDKAAGNVRKHALAFAEASTLFTSGVDYLEIFDVEHSAED